MLHPVNKTILPAVILAILLVGQVVSAAPLHYDSGPVSGFMYDNFDDNAIDPSIWSAGQEGGPMAAETNQRLEITLPANSAGAKFSASYYSACQLHGDFDIQVDYELMTWPTTNGVRLSLSTSPANVERASFGATGDFAGGPEAYLADFAGAVYGITPTSDLSGKLRLTRNGYSISAYYYSGGSWKTIHSHSAAANIADTSFALASWSHDPVFADQEVKLAFDNLLINFGELVCPSSAGPALAITQTADQEKVSIGDPVGFTITVTNNGDAAAQMVTLSDTLPTSPSLSWSVGGTDASACVLTSGALSCDFGDISPGTEKTIRLTSPTQYTGDKGFCQVISSTATVMASNQPVNRSATATTEVQCPSAYINVWSDDPGWQAGEQISFNAEFGNAGDGVAKDALVEIVIPTNPGLNWSIESISPAGIAGSCAFGDDPFGTYELICSFDPMPAGLTAAVTLTSPTTTESCGPIDSTGYFTLSNGRYSRSTMKSPYVNCPAGDTTPPVINPIISGALGANSWYTSDVDLSWTYTDLESPISSLTGCKHVTITQDQAVTEYPCSATSDGGTSSTSVTIARDATKPVTAVTGVSEGASYELGSVPLAGCASSDNLSGMAAEAALALTGGDAQGVGEITATCSGALDAAGNTADEAAVHFTVANPGPVPFNFTGFFQPVDNWPIENTMKAGAGVPIRFSLGGDFGLNVLAEGSPSSREVTCPSGSSITTDAIEQTTTSTSKLNYDAVSEEYIYAWKTDKAWKGTCRVFTIQFVDGTSQQILFKFTK